MGRRRGRDASTSGCCVSLLNIGGFVGDDAYSGCSRVSGDHDDRADRAVLGDKTGGIATANLLTFSPTLIYSNKMYLVVRTTMAPAFCSRLALTAAIAQVSDVGTGTGARRLSSSY
jgi:hypothetical protein